MYRLQPAGFESLGQWVDEVRSLWSEQLTAFKAHVERQAHRGSPARGRR
jgi:hypothetical protein